MPQWVQTVAGSSWFWAVLALLVGYSLTLFGIPVYTWWERRGAGLIQLRPGPNRRGPYGLVQAIADAVKLAVKEDVVPQGADRFLHALAPALVMTVALTTFAIIPWSGDFELFGRTVRLQVADLNVGILFIMAVSSLAVHGIALAGWSSNSKYSLLGGLRSAAQMISYELAMGLALVAVVLATGAVGIHQMVADQAGAVWHWGVFQAPVAFIIFIAAAYAEANRVPFDLVEADSEIVAGYHTEYSSLRFGLFYMAEYVHMAVSAALTALLFFGGWHLPWIEDLLGAQAYARLFPWFMLAGALFCLLLAWDVRRPVRKRFTRGNDLMAVLCVLAAAVLVGLALVAWKLDIDWVQTLAAMASQVVVLVVKLLFFFWLFIWVRWTLPRFRYDQLMRLGWKVFLPLGLANVAVTAVLVVVGWL
jgi:NADH-quinone oxidoreductase subunit H